jgi:hypothetical protein
MHRPSYEGILWCADGSKLQARVLSYGRMFHCTCSTMFPNVPYRQINGVSIQHVSKPSRRLSNLAQLSDFRMTSYPYVDFGHDAVIVETSVSTCEAHRKRKIAGLATMHSLQAKHAWIWGA